MALSNHPLVTFISVAELTTDLPKKEAIDIYQNYPHKITALGYTVVATILSFVWVFGTIFNVASLATFASDKKLRSPTNMFVMALNFCDLCMSCVGTFMAMTSAWNRQWLYGRAGCIFEGFMVYFLGLTSMYLLNAISLNRYIVITKPLLGPKITPMVAGVCIALCWGLGFLWAAFPLVGWNEYVLEGAGISCSVVWESANPNYTTYIFTIFIFCFVIPLVLIAFSYYGILMTIRSLSRKQTFDKSSRISKKNLKVEKKMAKTIAVVLAGFWGCWLPYTIFSFIVVFKGSDAVTPELATYPAILAKSQGLWDPLLYVASNKQFRKAFYNLLPCSGLREALQRREEEPEDSDDDEDRAKATTAVTACSSKSGNKVAPIQTTELEPNTVIEYIDLPNVKGGVASEARGSDVKVESVELQESAPDATTQS